MDWPEGYKLAAAIGFSFPKFVPTSLKTIIPNAPDEAIDLMHQMMQFNPLKRPTATQCLQHEYFRNFSPPNIASSSKYANGSKKNFFNPANEINTQIRKSSATKRLESRKSKLESQGKINKNSFYKLRSKNPDYLPNKPMGGGGIYGAKGYQDNEV